MEKHWYRVKGCLVAHQLSTLKDKLSEDNLTPLDKYNILVEIKILLGCLDGLSDGQRSEIHNEMSEIIAHC